MTSIFVAGFFDYRCKSGRGTVQQYNYTEKLGEGVLLNKGESYSRRVGVESKNRKDSGTSD